MGMQYNADTETWEYVDDGDLSVFDNYAGTDLTSGAPVYAPLDPNYVAPDSTVSAKVDETGAALPSFSSSSTPSGLASLISSLKGMFVDKNNNINWNTALPLLGGLFGAYQNLSGANNPNTTKVGYQGTVPKLRATRTRLPVDTDPNRRPGSKGRRYFSDVTYSPAGSASPQTTVDSKPSDTFVGPQQPSPSFANTSNPQQGLSQLYGETTLPASKPQPWEKAITQVPPAATQPAATQPAATQLATTQPATTQPATTRSLADALTPSWSSAARNRAQAAAMAQQAAMAQRGFAYGGLMGLAAGGSTGEPRYLAGHTDGMADELPASIDDRQPAKLSHGEFVIPADVVGHLGNGNSEAGAKRLYEMMARIRKARTGNPDQGKRINPNKFLPS